MKTEAIDFCKKYKEKLYNEEIIKKDELSFLEELKKLCLKYDISIVIDEYWFALTDYTEENMKHLLKAKYEPLGEQRI